MNLPVFYLQNIPPGNVIALGEDTSRHMVQVLRMKPGDRLQLTNGAGSVVTAAIIDGHKKKCTVAVANVQQMQPKKQQVSIAISLLKNVSRFEWFLEKATEIGISEIIPLMSHRTEKQHFRFERMQQILISAMLQSQQAWLPRLHQPGSFESVVQSSSYTTRLIAHCLEKNKTSVTDFRLHESVQILIGPEGDFTQAEIELALTAGYIPVMLGHTRLRTETAGMVAATVLCI